MKTILIVDDEARIRTIYTKLLERRGYLILNAENAVKAREMIINHDLDLILLDVNLGDVDGTDLYEVAAMFHPAIKVIVTSVYPLSDQKRLIPKAVGYYDKSERVGFLLEKIDTVLRKRESADRAKTVLVIDDDPKERFLFHKVLEKEGYHSIEIGDNFDVFKILAKQADEIDLIVLDLAMPCTSGVDFFEIIKAKYPKKKVLISSHFPITEQEFQIFDADDYFDKTQGYRVFAQKVHQLMNSQEKEGARL